MCRIFKKLKNNSTWLDTDLNGEQICCDKRGAHVLKNYYQAFPESQKHSKYIEYFLITQFTIRLQGEKRQIWEIK